MLSKAPSSFFVLLLPLFATLAAASPVNRRQDDGDNSDTDSDSGSSTDGGATVTTAGTSPSLNVMTETDLTWCRPFADEMADVTTYYYEPTAITVTCWAQSTMQDSKGQIDGDSIYLKESSGCWINEEFIQGGGFTSTLSQCTPPPHMVGFPKDSYYVSNQGIACYSSPAVTSAVQYVALGYIDLGCGTQGAAVNGNSTWVKWADGQCYFPGDTFTPSEFHGYSVGNC